MFTRFERNGRSGVVVRLPLSETNNKMVTVLDILESSDYNSVSNVTLLELAKDKDTGYIDYELRANIKYKSNKLNLILEGEIHIPIHATEEDVTNEIFKFGFVVKNPEEYRVNWNAYHRNVSMGGSMYVKNILTSFGVSIENISLTHDELKIIFTDILLKEENKAWNDPKVYFPITRVAS